MITDNRAPTEEKRLATWGTDVPEDLVLDQKKLAEALRKVICLFLFIHHYPNPNSNLILQSVRDQAGFCSHFWGGGSCTCTAVPLDCKNT